MAINDRNKILQDVQTLANDADKAFADVVEAISQFVIQFNTLKSHLRQHTEGETDDR